MSDQENYWKGPEGKAYLERNPATPQISLRFFYKVLRSFDLTMDPLKSALEFGANDGRNLKALKFLGVPYVSGVEVNPDAYQELMTVADSSFCQSILDFESGRCWDLVFTKGCLIHIPPEDIDRAFNVIHTYAFRYILMAEYFSPRWEEVLYRGRSDLLWKGPYAEKFLKRFPKSRLRDYG
jgi:spore coat polysaccharide biosynthesis protein SpsF